MFMPACLLKCVTCTFFAGVASAFGSAFSAAAAMVAVRAIKQ